MAYLDYIYTGAGAIVGLLAGLLLARQKHFNESELQSRTQKILDDAAREGATVRERARARVSETREQIESEKKEFTAQLERMEKALEVKTNSSKKREAKILEIQTALKNEEETVRRYREEIARLDGQTRAKLFSLTGFSETDVRGKILDEYERNMTADRDLRVARRLEWDTESSVREARNILTEVMDRFAGVAATETLSGEIKVQHDEVKGRIVGRGGRLIAFFEELFAVDVIFNDEPDTIIVSCFNLVQQEIARKGLERLMKEKVITEEVIKKVKALAEQDVDKMLQAEGLRALKLLGLANMPSLSEAKPLPPRCHIGASFMPPDFAKLVGRLKFRTSYGQNIMRHCFEVGYFAKLIASEVGANEETALLGGFFHDIGKAIDQEVGGSHDVLSKEILEKYGFSPEIVHAAWTHHNAIPQETVEARIVQAADAISAGRPGARAESVARYLEKIKDLQETAFSFPGVKKAYAINAGRELRVVVEPDKVTDANVPTLAQDIATKVQEKGGYPGKIKIVTMRSTKATDYAR